MEHLKLFESIDTPLKVLYLHGLGGKQDKKQLKVLKSLGFKCIAPNINYKKGNCWDKLANMEFDVVIGHSLGGYLAYYLSNLKKVPCLMFMPDFDDNIRKIQPVPNEVLNLPKYGKKRALIATLDSALDRTHQKKFLKEIKTYKEKIDHDVPIEIFSKYCKRFKKYVLGV